MDAFGRFFSLVLAFLMLFIAPLSITKARKQMVHDLCLITETDRFLSQIRYSGYLEKDSLNTFLNRITGFYGIEKVELIHRRRAIKPVFEKGEIINTKEIFFEFPFQQIKESLEQNYRYCFFIGDEIIVSISKKEEGIFFIGGQPIEMGGMIENECKSN